MTILTRIIEQLIFINFINYAFILPTVKLNLQFYYIKLLIYIIKFYKFIKFIIFLRRHYS